MRIDLRVKHDVETRRHAAEPFDSSTGCRRSCEQCVYQVRQGSYNNS